MKTWHYELMVVAFILCATTFLFSNNLINWITTAAIIITFQHAQIGDRLQERQKFWTSHRITAFILMQNYAAIIGSFMFSLYPVWRKYYRTKIKPLRAESVSADKL